MGQKLKNMGIVKSKRATKRNADPEPVLSESDQERMDVAIDFLKSVVVNESNLNEIQEKLTDTMEYRHDLMKNTRTVIKETFPFFFFACPELIIDFRFFGVCHQLIHFCDFK